MTEKPDGGDQKPPASKGERQSDPPEGKRTANQGASRPNSSRPDRADKTLLDFIPTIPAREKPKGQSQSPAADEGRSTGKIRDLSDTGLSRRAAKTLLYMQIPTAAGTPQSLAQKEAHLVETFIEPSQSPQQKPIAKISRRLVDRSATKIDISPGSPGAGQAPPTVSPQNARAQDPLVQSFSRVMEPERQIQVPVDRLSRTMLDHSVLYGAVVEAAAKQEKRVAEQVKERAKLPVPETNPVKASKTSLRCPWQWSEDDSTDKVRYCKKCQTPVYNFAGMERRDAEVLIFIRENRRKMPLFARTDGKFMTRNCPEAVKAQRNFVLSTVAGVACLIIATVVVLTLSKPTPRPDTKPSAQANSQSGVSKSATGSTAVRTSTGITVNFSDLDHPKQKPATNAAGTSSSSSSSVPASAERASENSADTNNASGASSSSSSSAQINPSEASLPATTPATNSTPLNSSGYGPPAVPPGGPPPVNH